MKGIYWQTLCDLPNKSKLHIVQLHAVDVPSIDGNILPYKLLPE